MSRTASILATVAIISTAGWASAQTQSDAGDYFSNVGVFSSAKEPIVDMVVASAAGEVTLYDYENGMMGAAIAMEPVMAGANFNLFELPEQPSHNVIAILRINGMVVAAHEYMHAADAHTMDAAPNP